MVLFKLWIFDINLSFLFSFLFGIAFGIAIFALLYLIVVFSTMRNKKYVVITKVKDVDDNDIKIMIKQTQDMFKDRSLKGEASTLGYCKELSSALVVNIAKKFFPKSKHPLYELSVDEVLLLSVYISKRLDEILDNRGLRYFRKIKISTIIGFGDMKKSFDDNPLIKATKKYKIKETLRAAKSVINIVNPIYWVRKFVVNTVFDVVMKKLCLIIIGVVGEETYKIYSKSVFNKDVSIDIGIEKLVEEIKTDMDKGYQESLKEDDNSVAEINEEPLVEEEDFIASSIDETLEKKKGKKGFFMKK